MASPALSYTAMHLSAAVEAVRQGKLLQEEQELEQENEIAVFLFLIVSDWVLVDFVIYLGYPRWKHDY